MHIFGRSHVKIHPMQLRQLITQAVDFHQSSSSKSTNSTAIPLCFESVVGACELLTDVVTFEAQRGLSSPLRNPPSSDNCRRHRVRATLDLDGDNPGIWTRDGIVTLNDSQQNASAASKPIKAKKRVTPEIEAKRALNKVTRMKEQKEKFEASREIKAKKRKENACKKKEMYQEGTDHEPSDGDNGTDDEPSDGDNGTQQEANGSTDDEPSEKNNSAHTRDGIDGCKLVESSKTSISMTDFSFMTPLMAWKRWRRFYSTPPLDSCLNVDSQVPRTPTIAARHKLYESPVSYVRDINALQRCGIHPALREPLLNCTVDTSNHIVGTDGLRIVQGPPGTGKTFTILEELRTLNALPAIGPTALKRILITAPTNQAVDELARRAQSLGLFATTSRRKKTVLWSTPEGQSNGFGSSKPLSDVKGSVWVFCTVSSRNSRFMENFNFDVVIVDEAGLVPEPSMWGLLRDSTRRLVLVGDYKQLRCMSSQAGKHLQHDRSTMERLILNKYPYEFLNHQHRMVSPIAGFVSTHFYAGKLLNGSNAPGNMLSQSLCIAKPDSGQGSAEKVGTSWKNEGEALMAVKEAKQLRRQLMDAGISCNVAILVPYTAQLECIQRILGNELEYPLAMTIDSAQGREFDAVVLSTVRTGKNKGFWECKARALVALTRGKYGLRIVGSRESWMQWGGIWNHIARLQSV